MIKSFKLLCLAWAVLAVTQASAQNLTARPITLLVGIGAGSSIDIAARQYAAAASKVLGASIVVENRPGGSGMIAAQALKNAQPDGHTLMVGFSAVFNTLPWMQQLPLDPIAEFEPVTELFRFPSYMTVSSSVPTNDARQFIESLRNKPGGSNFGSGGNFSTAHLTGLLVAKSTGIAIQHVPYNQPSQYLIDLAQQRIDFQFMPYSTSRGQIEGGALKILAVGGLSRTRRFPDIPSLRELGMQEVDLPSWFGLFAPKGTDPAIVQTLSKAFGQASQDPDLVARMAADGTEPRNNTPAAFLSFIKDDQARYGVLLKDLGLLNR